MWLVVIERDPDRAGWPWWIKWLVVGLSVIGLTAILTIRWIENGHPF